MIDPKSLMLFKLFEELKNKSRKNHKEKKLQQTPIKLIQTNKIYKLCLK